MYIRPLKSRVSWIVTCANLGFESSFSRLFAGMMHAHSFAHFFSELFLAGGSKNGNKASWLISIR
jgi:hypothetical protein